MDTQGRFNNPKVCSLYKIMLMATNVVEWMKMGNIAPKSRIKPTSLAFLAIVLTITLPRLPDLTTLPTTTCLLSTLMVRSEQTSTLAKRCCLKGVSMQGDDIYTLQDTVSECQWVMNMML